MATIPIGNADTKERQEVRAEFHEEVDGARGLETELNQIEFWAARHNRELWLTGPDGTCG